MILRRIFAGVLLRLQYILYSFIKIQTLSAKNQLPSSLQLIINIVLAIILAPLQLIILLSIELFRQIIGFTLKIFVSDFGGLLTGQDSVWAKVSQGTSKCAPAVLALVEYEDPKMLHQKIQKRYMDMFDTGLYQKAYNLIESFCGFYYYKKTHKVMIDEHVVKLDNYVDKDTFEQALEKVINEDFPINNMSLWRVYVGYNPITWKKTSNNSRKIYPVLYKMHHSMGDGISLLNLFVDIFADDGNSVIKNIYKEMNQKIIRSNTENRINSKFLKFKLLLKKLFTLRFKSLHLTQGTIKHNMLYGSELSGKKYVCFKTEDNQDLVQKVKMVKAKLNVSFTDVVNAAISASFADYINKYSTDKIPESITATIVVMLGAMDLAKEVSRIEGRLQVKLNNKFTSGNLEFPIRKFLDTNRHEGLQEHILNINRESVLLRNSVDLAYNEWQLRIPTPSPISRYIFQCCLGAMIISSLPGCGRLTILDGHDLHDMAFWIPNMMRSGIGVSVQTYDDRFQMGLLVDQVIIGEKRHLAEILDGVFEYLRRFYQEVVEVVEE